MAENAAMDALLDHRQREVAFKQAQVDKLTHELAVLKRLKFAATSEKFCAGLSAEQKTLLEETLDSDVAEASAEIDRAKGDDKGKDKKDKQQPKRAPLPPHLPRREVHHEPESTACTCGCQMKRIGQDISEKLDYEPGVFTV
jgi:transposase